MDENLSAWKLKSDHTQKYQLTTAWHSRRYSVPHAETNNNKLLKQNPFK